MIATAENKIHSFFRYYYNTSDDNSHHRRAIRLAVREQQNSRVFKPFVVEVCNNYNKAEEAVTTGNSTSDSSNGIGTGNVATVATMLRDHQYNSNNNDCCLTLQELREAEQLFRELDADGDGYLDLDELDQGLRKLRLPTSRTQLCKLVQEICEETSGNGRIDLQAFTAFLERRKDVTLEQAYQWILQQTAATASATASQTHNNNSSNGRGGFATGISRTATSANIRKRLSEPNGDQHDISFKEQEEPVDPPMEEVTQEDSNATTESSCNTESASPSNTTFGQQVTKRLTVGGMAGCMSRTLTAPIDRIRILMMTSVERIGIRQALQQGTAGGMDITQLWRGNGVNCIKIAPEMATKLFTFDFFQNMIASDPEHVAMSERFIAGGLAGVTAQVSIYPMEVLKTKLAVLPVSTPVSAGPFHHLPATAAKRVGLMDCLQHTVARGGYRALYAGIGPSVVGIIPYAAIDLSMNSTLKELAASYQGKPYNKQETSVPVLLGCGMASSGTATLMTFPLNVIRTKAQATGDSFGTVVRSLLLQNGGRSGGIRAFYRGIVPCLAKVLPSTSISYTAYEYLGKAWDKS